MTAKLDVPAPNDRGSDFSQPHFNQAHRVIGASQQKSSSSIADEKTAPPMEPIATEMMDVRNVLDAELIGDSRSEGLDEAAVRLPATGMARSGIGLALNSFWQGFASKRDQRFALFLRALSVAIPVLAYICR